MITLAEAKVGMSNKVDQQIVDEFRRSSLLLDRLTFDNAVSPGTGGSTLGYSYVQLVTPSTASFRAINNEYVKNQAKRKELTAYLKIFGGSFEIDRVIINTSGVVNELSFQMSEKIKGAANLFHYTVINGDRAVNNDEFDGLDTLLSGSKTEVDGSIDISTSDLLKEKKHTVIDLVSRFLAQMDGKPTMLLANTELALKLASVARRAGYFTQSEDAFGRQVDNFAGIPIVDLKQFYDESTETTKPVVPIVNGKTDLYAVQLGIDGFHGVSPTGNNIIQSALPDLKSPGVLKKGDVEMVAAVVLKNSLKAGVLRGIKVQ